MQKKISTLVVLCLVATFSNAQVTEQSKTNPDSSVFVSTLDDLDNTGFAGQAVSGLLQSSRDVFTNTAAFNFGVARFKIRGYQSNQTLIMINGIPMNDLESGRGTWYKWGGLNDVTRYAESQRWLGSNPYHFGGLGGYSNIDATPSGIRTGHQFSYASTNRAYRHRLMYTYSSGILKNKWAFAASASTRFAKEGYVEGTFYEAFAYFFAGEKQINDKHHINFSILGAPSFRGGQGLPVVEAYELSGDQFYNANWGYQTLPDGSQIKRNARTSVSHMPIITFTHDMKLNEKSNLNSSVYTTFGKYGRTSLNWNDANDPRPDYYRYLPSYFEGINDQATANYYTDLWTNDPAGRQIQWDDLYAANVKNLYSQDNANGAGENITGNRSKYIIENRWNNIVNFGGNTKYNKKINDMYNFTAGAFFQYQRNHYFKTVNDLLGGDFWLDIDRFASQVGVDPQIQQNEISIPNRIVGVGDKFDYDYYIHNYKTTAFAQLDITTKKIDGYVAAELSDVLFYREGLNQNGKFPDDSKGNSEKSNFLNYAVKAGAVYKLSGRQFIKVNGIVKTQAPYSRDAFVSPRTRNYLVTGLENEMIYSGDISYILRYPKLKMRATYYRTIRNNAVWSRSFYHDTYNNFVNYTMTGVNYLHQGLEFGLQGNITGKLQASAVVALGQHLYTSRPTANVSIDNSAVLLDEGKTIYLKNYKVGGMPQSAFSLGLKYNGKKYWFAGVNFNYMADIYLDPNPDRRTAEAVENFVTTDPQWNEVLDQTKLDNGYTVSAFLGKSFKIKGKFLNLSANLNNITNNQNFQTGGFEQLRFESQSIGKFPPRLANMYGFNYFISAKLRF